MGVFFSLVDYGFTSFAADYLYFKGYYYPHTSLHVMLTYYITIIVQYLEPHEISPNNSISYETTRSPSMMNNSLYSFNPLLVQGS